ncbi:amino acid adenylation domain-containing protein [Tumebacillus sp. BK434]|uniref:non-ribosomal peptide synthase/polyketide synthase n=1 Tax=Tumebacillus sp. BK434 TaxID=2512169 RepID=UPI0010492808|nr:non-ribosomal peptide synthase/polyketide synthase [Tumebacillus sp. BK434]TCP59139.1 amino acid adenylation domain-containing protein [Tumebacillus sp. BK434]
MTHSANVSLSAPHKSLVDLLRRWTEQQPDHIAYLFLRDGEIEDGRLTYGELDRKARALAAQLQKLGMQGERALLLYQPGLDFIAAFFGCIYAGVTAVPVYPPKMNRKMIRLESIVSDATPSFSLTTSAIMDRVEPLLEGSPELQKMIWIATDQIDEALAAEWLPPAVGLDTLAFIQYTSGSTGSPKGVMVSHGNLLHNEEMIAQAFDQSKDSLILGWLPLYHDMGLIGNVLQPLYLGTSCILMSPIDFLQHPYRWLKAISDYKATTSGGPNFAYELCARKITPEQIATLDLSSWSVAFNGAEPIHPATLDLFADTFASTGFRKEAFYACYGLAEATLFVTGGLQTDLPVVKLADKEAMNLNRVVLTDTNDENVQPFVGSGKSWMEQRVLIVNPDTGLVCPEDQVGEIWVQGPSVAKGYWENPELSEYTFHAHLTDTGEGPFLRTGDLGFQLEGELYVTGRLKDLIIIRGRNHYPQDIESTVGACHTALNPGAGAAFSVDVSGEERLVVVQEVERAVWRRVNVEEVTAAVRQAVATHHELQAHAVVLIKPASIPKTSSGKIQRRACKEMFLNGTLQVIGDSKPGAADTVAAAEEPSVAMSREMWESTVHAERLPLLVRYLKGQVGRALRMPASRLEDEQPLSTLGLDSLMAIELKHAIETDLGVRIAEVDFLQDANALQLAEQIQLQLQAEQTNVQLPVMTRQQAGGEYPLSYGQQTMWFLHRYQPESKAYHVPFAMRITSELNTAALQAAWEQMIARHAVLRTTYGERDGQPFQKVHAHWPAQLEVIDTSALSEQEVSRLLQARAYAPFALQDGPAYRLCLLSHSAADHVLLLSFHHIAVDLWSISVLMDELWTLYAAHMSGQPRELAVPDLQYTDYVDWQKGLLNNADGERLLSYWQQRLQGTLPVLELPADHLRPAVQSYRGASHAFELTSELTFALKKMAKEAGTTLYVVLLAAYQAFLHRYTGQDDILVGTPAAGRSSARFQQQIGYFVNPVVMRADFSERPAFRDFLHKVRVSVLEALKHQDYPFPLLVEKIGAPRNASHNPVFQTMFVLQKPHKQNGSEDFVLGATGAQLQLGGVTLMPIALQQEAAQFDVTLSMVDGKDFLRGAWEFNTDLFEASTLARMTGHFMQLLEGITKNPNAAIKDLPMLAAEELQTLLVDWNRTATPYPSAQTIPSLFAEVASKTPQKVAVTFADQSLTYRELDERANQLANRLRREGVGPDVLVGLCMKRSPEMIVGLLGILKAGGAYLPIDPAYPQDRQGYMLEDAKITVLLAQTETAASLPAHAATVILLDGDNAELAGESTELTPAVLTADHPVYVIYTSGSTGKPKGVLVPHRGVARLVRDTDYVSLTEEEVVLQVSSISFDAATFEIWGCLLNGGRLVLYPGVHLSLEELGRVLRDEQVTTALLTAVVFHQMVDEQLDALCGLKQLLAAGEALSPAHVRTVLRELPHVRMINAYGPTECTVLATAPTLTEDLIGKSVSIGRPIANTEAYVLDENLRPVPVGVPGELLLGGAGLAIGYLNRPELTAEKYIPHPFAEGERLYRTGDLVRWLANGTLEFMGRLDHQVKIRGYRVELGEIEALLDQHPGVMQAVVTAQEYGVSKRLVAYFVPALGEEITQQELRGFLQDKLPEYMVPSVFVTLSRLPVTANGKIDRKALPAPANEFLSEEAFVAPRTETEARVAAIWAQVLQLESIGVHDSFFDIGGHSLLATQVISRLRQTFGIELEMSELFQYPTVAGLAARVELAGQTGVTAAELAIAPLVRTAASSLPVSSAQRRLWLLDQLMPGHPVYNMPGAVRLQGRLNREALENSLHEIVRRHEVLRSAFVEVNGELRQVATSNLHTLQILDLSGAPFATREEAALRATREEATRPFDLAHGPLFRATLVQLGAEDHLLLITFHHIIADGWSVGLFVREWTALYEAFVQNKPSPLPELSIQYADYTAWQEARLEKELLAEQLPYWKGQLAGNLPLLQLPTDHPRPVVQSYAGKTHRFALSSRLTEQLSLLSRQEGATLYMTLLTAFTILLHRSSGQDDLLVGTPVAGRSHTQAEELIGMFVNTLVVRTDASGNPTFRELLGRVKESVLGAFAHQDMPFDKLVEELQPERDMSYSPLFQVMFALQNAKMPEISMPELTARRADADNGTAKYDLTLFMEDQADGLHAALEYNTTLFETQTIERMAGHLEMLLSGLVKDPDRPIGLLPLLRDAERRQLLIEWNDTSVPYPQDLHFVEMFLQQAALRPDAEAAVFEEEHLTYAELNRRANQVAHVLQQHGVQPNVLVGILAERSLDLLVGLIGIWKAGGAYLPIDPSYPKDRLAYMLQDSGVKLLLTQEHLLHVLPEQRPDCIVLDGEQDAAIIGQAQSDEPHAPISADDLAYVIYTSGSTGRPKGTLIRHGGLSNYLLYAREAYGAAQGTGVPVHSSIAFDLTITGLFVPLTAGQRVILVPHDHGVDSLLRTLRSHQDLSYIKLTPAHLRLLGQALSPEEAAGLTRGLVIGGEALSGEDVALWREFAPHTTLYNEYGPTETVVGCCMYQLAAGDAPAGPLLIGKPIANTCLYILDANLQPVPANVYGELYIGGAGVALGYLNRDDLTEERFLPDPFATEPGARMYKTGDAVRYRADGNLEYKGRLDDQVKIRGYRIELGEIESAITGHPAVKESVLIAAPDLAGEQRLLAYSVLQEAQTLDAAGLRRHLQAVLPDYMVPSVFVFLDALPLTANGKVDRAALPAPDLSHSFSQEDYLAPRTPLEMQLASIWSELLGVDRVGSNDNFFTLGGHSLLATQVMSRIRQQAGLDIPLSELFAAPVLTDFAARLATLLNSGAGEAADAAIKPAAHGDLLPLSYAQRRMWLLDQLLPGHPLYNTAGAVRLHGQLDISALETSISVIVSRHSVLRSSFRFHEGDVQQIAGPDLPFALGRIDLSFAPAAEREELALQQAAKEAELPFNLEQGPLFRATLVKIAEQDHLLLLTFHHIVSDGWSVGVFTRELTALYAAFVQGQPSPLPELSIQYADYALWQQERILQELKDTQLPYWKNRLIGDLPLLQLPADHPRPAVQRYAGGLFRFALPTRLTERLHELSRQENATLYMTLLAAFKTLLHHYSGQDDLLIGTPVAGRNHAQIEDLVGFFVNTLVVRTDAGGNPSFRELLSRVKDATLGAYAHQDVPFDMLVEELQPARDMSYSPLFQVMFVLQNAPMPELDMPHLTAHRVDVDGSTAKFDLTLFMEEQADGLTAAFEYSSDLFEAATIERMAEHFVNLLEQIAATPEAAIGELAFLGETDLQQLLIEWNSTKSGYPQLTLPQLVAAQAAKTPDAVALIDGERRLTYSELNARANQLAHYLKKHGVGAESLVGLCMERSDELVVAILGILKAGGAYVPLDPNYPQERILFTLEDASVTLLLTEKSLTQHLTAYEGTTVCLDGVQEEIALESADNPAGGAEPHHLAYVIYTSGSTGRPKGVAIEHRSASTLVQWANDVYSPPEYAGVLFSTSICFDLSIFELFVPLSLGGKVILAENALHLPELSAREEVTLINTVPSAIAELHRMQAIPASVRVINLAGEPLKLALVQSLYEWPTVDKVFNLYGPSEDTTYSTFALMERGLTTSPLIGRPLADTQAYVLNQHLQPVPIGAAGELFLGGAGLARGYLNRPELTREKFILSPFAPKSDERLYRTGDLVRYTQDGSLAYLGRIDHQVKVRGFRIELGEIEMVLAQHALVHEATVIVREDLPGEPRIVAYAVAKDPLLLSESDLRQAVKKKLPEYMVPSAFIMLDALPLTPNGKIDRKALPAPDLSQGRESSPYLAPGTETEHELAAVWSEVLGLDKIGLADNFFALGGHSLLATQMISRVRQQFNIDLTLRSLFEASTLADFAARVEAERAAISKSSIPALVPAPRDQHLPLSFAQQRMWLLDQLSANGSAYQMPLFVRLSGSLDTVLFERTLQEIVRRHEVLRTTYRSENGTAAQTIHGEAAIPIPLHDLSALAASEQEHQKQLLLQTELERPFDLAVDLPLRALLLKIAVNEHLLLLTMHHIASDGWSLGVLVREFAALYTAFATGQHSPLPELSIQYADYALWQRSLLQGDAVEEQVRYWQEQLSGELPVLILPTVRPRPAVQTFKGATYAFSLTQELHEQLNAFSRQEGATMFMMLFSAFNALLHRYSSQDDIILGTPIAGRGTLELEPLIGLFVNTLALRTDLSGNPSFRELVGHVRDKALGAYAHQDLPFELLLDRLQVERDASRHPLFQVMFVLQNTPLPAIELPNLSLQPLDLDTGTAKFDLTLVMTETEQVCQGVLEYNTDLFDEVTIARISDHLQTLTARLLANPDLPLSQVQYLTEAETSTLLTDWSTRRPPLGSDPVHHLFEQQAARMPDATAVRFGEQTLTYAELNLRANQLAHKLRKWGVGPETRVGISVTRSPEMVIGLLGILKSGGAYVPLDPAYPEERLAFMLEDATVPVLLTQEALQDRFAQSMRPDVLFCLDSQWEQLAAESGDNPSARTEPHHLAYIIYTSGSTGRPKGVQLEHRGLTNLTLAQIESFGISAESRLLQFASFSFDASVSEIFTALVSGATLHMASRDELLPGADLIQLLQEQEISVVTLPPSVLALLPSDQFPALQTVVSAGEACSAELVRAWAPGRTFINAYGPTETTVCATLATLGPDTVRPHIGQPITGAEIYILDDHLQAVPVGVAGEIYIGGIGVARGYLNRPELTDAAFVAHPFRTEPGARLYKSGDLGRWQQDGTIEYLGRRDHQVKIRGFRIEVGELEAALLQHAAVREAVVIATTDSKGAARLIAYVTSADSIPLSAADLRSHLQATLPDYMVPAAFVCLDAFPLTANGKVDRQALPAADLSRDISAADYLAPRSQTEEVLALIWSDLLGIERIGMRDDFFALGGHSLLAAQVMSRVQIAFGLQLPLRELFDAPSVERLAARIERIRQDAQGVSLPPIARIAKDGELPLSFSQERMWFVEQLEPGTSAYNMPGAIRLHGRLNQAALEQSVQEIIRRHETLRTRFTESDGQPKQHIAAELNFVIPFLDLEQVMSDSREQALQQAIHAESRRPFDLAAGPLLRMQLVRLAAEEHVLLLTMHHIVSDGWSTGVLLRELGALYEAFDRGVPSPLPDLEIQYADYAHWERAWMQGDVLHTQLRYWKEQLAGELPVLQLPLDRPRPALRTYRGATESFVIQAGLFRKLQTLTRREGASLYMTLLAAFKSLLARYTGQEDVIVGSPVAGRLRQETEPLIGVFINTLVMRTDLSGGPTFRELLARVRKTALDAFAHQSVPFERLLEELQPARNLSISPLFQVMFILNNAPMEALQLPDITLTPEAVDTGTAKYDLTMTLSEAQEPEIAETVLHGSLNYNADLFNATTIVRLMQHFLTLLAEIAEDPDQNVFEVPLLSETERDLMLRDWNDTARDYPQNMTLPQLVEEQAVRTPDQVAVELSGELLTYRELNERANQVAHRLQTLGAGPDVPIGICMERSFDMIVGLLGILKSGAAYVPLDPTFPSGRLAYLLEDSQVPVLLTQEHLRERLPATQAHVITLDSERESLDAAFTANPARELSSEHMAYIIYTSGSTGNPKGVMVLQRGISNILHWMRETYELTAADRVLQKANFSFDASVWEIFLPLMCGARLVLAKPGGQQDPEYLISLIQESGITMTHFIPPMLQMFLETDGVEKCAALRHVFCGGEVLPRDLQERFSKRLAAQLHNRYGPTEITINATAWTCEPGDARSSVPIGRPLANVQAYVLDRTLQPVPVGVPGELHIGGHGVARGYWKRDELTAEKFIADPFSGHEQARLYKTGDLVRWLPDGTLEFLGRIDEQVKLRGYRVELGEIQAALEQHPAVREAALLVREDVPGDMYLTAYAVAHAEMQVTVEELRGYLQTSLPEFMIPAAIVLLDAMPLTPVGKVDRKALPKPDKSKALSETYVAPRNEIEAQLAEIWSNLLGVSPVGVHDNFFELGGHSLLATRLITRIRNTFQVELPIRALFGATTVAQLAPLVEQAKQTPASEPEEPDITARSRSTYRMKKGK